MVKKKTATASASGYVEYLPSDIDYAFVQLVPNPTVGIIINAHERVIKIYRDKGSKAEAQFDVCNSCSFFKAEQKVKEELEAANIPPGLLKNKAIQHYRESNKCPGVLTKHSLGIHDCKANAELEGVVSIKVNVPMTMWVKEFTQSSRAYKVYCVKDLEKGLITKPFLYANVYNDAKVCWGGNPAPNDLLTAYGTYWSAPFNHDLVVNKVHSLQYTLQNFDPEKLTRSGVDAIRWEDKAEEFLGRVYCYTDRPSKAVVVFKKLDLIEGITDRHLHAPSFNERQAVGWAKKNPLKDEWFITIYPVDKKLSSEQKIQQALIVKKKTLDPSRGKAEILGIARDLFVL